MSDAHASEDLPTPYLHKRASDGSKRQAAKLHW